MATPARSSNDLDAVASLIGEGVHTMLRKGCDSAASSRAWAAINELPDEEWSGVCQTVARDVVAYLDRAQP